MKIVLPMLVFGLLAVSAEAADSDDQLPPPAEGKAWQLVWHDEFDGDKLDESKWDVPDHQRRDGWWSPQAVAVVNGGQITDSESRKNEPEVWGRQAAWCQYGGTINGQRVGVVLMPDVQNFRRSWFHARDYGVLVANPFGQNAFTKGEKSKVTVQKGETFRLGFGVLIYGIPSGEAVDIAAAYRAYLEK